MYLLRETCCAYNNELYPVDVLIDTVEVLSPLERLIMVISDLETYRNMQLLNDLL